MRAYHVHIKGQVQGVGFRPYVHRLANELDLYGWVSNGTDGVHLEIEGEARFTSLFIEAVFRNAPPSARITNHTICEVPIKNYSAFTIVSSQLNSIPSLLITPDLAICDDCKKEISDPNNHRHAYPFTTCTNCGPRYSILNDLPYDRMATTMKPFHLCEKCAHEYASITNRRFYSQTNSCPSCAITLSLCDQTGRVISQSAAEIFSQAKQLLEEGKIIAVKSIGGYLLLCDATQEQAIQTLRNRKERPRKPFALLYSSITVLQRDAHVSWEEENLLRSPAAPIVLLRTKPSPRIALQAIAPNLNEIGVMLPSAPLLQLISTSFVEPLVATSGNKSGSPIFYEDEKAIQHLSSVADYFIMHNRDILLPQDDSVLRVTPRGHKIVVRRSRGLAPTFLPQPLRNISETWLAMGSDLKSTFGILHQENVYASQYLGDLENFQTQENFKHTLFHWENLLRFQPQQVIIDRHPNYFSSELGRKLAQQWEVPVLAVQHHQAHFAAVLAENDLLQSAEPILGVIWDGTGWGNDGQSWGGEFFMYEDQSFERVAHLDYFPHLLGDKMSREPRLSALSICKDISGSDELLRSKFCPTEWTFYHKLLQQPNSVYTSSMGRLFDGIACLLGLCDRSTYEGEAALYLEALANRATQMNPRDSKLLSSNPLNLKSIVSDLIAEINEGIVKEEIAYHFHQSLVNWIEQMAAKQPIHKLAFSGGVFQNGLLVHLIQQQLGERYQLFFHHQLSPNDECLAIGQLAWLYIHKNRTHIKDSSSYELQLN